MPLRPSRHALLPLQQSQQREAADVVEQDDPFSSVSTKVTPVSTPEAASWSLVIVAAYALTGVLGYIVVSQLFMQKPEAAAFDAALRLVRDDFRVTVRLGDRIKGARTAHLQSAACMLRIVTARKMCICR